MAKLSNSILIFICLITILSSTIIDIELIWIDPKVNNKENKEYQDEFRKFNFVKLSCFENVSKGINYLKRLKFTETFIIASSRAYPEFIKLFKKNINELLICPRTIIFTKEKDNFLNIYKNNKELSINHPFFNSGSVEDTFYPVLYFLSHKQDYKFIPFNKHVESFAQELNFEYVQSKEQLILPIYLPDFIGQPVEKQIQKFNSYVLHEYKTQKELVCLFEQLINIEKIPIEIISKYWIRAYSLESDFYKTMNKDLRQANTINYLTYIQMMYQAIKIKSFPINKSKYLYRGTYFSYQEINMLKEYMYNKIKGLPGALVYCRAFYSFSLNKKKALYFLNNPKNNLKSVLLIIDNNNEYSIQHYSSASISKFSVFKDEEEILFFPFSCFEVKNIDESNKNYYIIYLNYFGKYEKLFKGKKTDELISLIPEYSNLAHDVFKSRIIKEEYNTYIPNWGRPYFYSKFQSFASYSMKKTVNIAKSSYNVVKNVATTTVSVAGSIVTAPFKMASSLFKSLQNVNTNYNTNVNYL